MDLKRKNIGGGINKGQYRLHLIFNVSKIVFKAIIVNYIGKLQYIVKSNV